MMEKIRLMNKGEGGYFTREEVVTALDLLYQDRAITFGVREGFAMQHQLERIATALERIADSYVEGVASQDEKMVFVNIPYTNDQSE